MEAKSFSGFRASNILIIGDFTGLIGDASDKDSLRPVLTEEQIKENMKDYTNQIGKILDTEQVELHYNSEWLDKLTIRELMRISMKFTAQQMIHRRNFKERWEQNKEIGLHEMFYPIFQGYDSVAIKADIEIGGTDQLFNLLTGRKMQEMFGQPPQDVMTTKMLSGTDGRKMSTSWGNIITIVDEAKEMYGKVMSMHDDCMSEYFYLCTQIPAEEIKEIEKILAGGKSNPRDIKARLAKEITTIYHGEELAEEAAQEFDRVFKNKELPSEIKEVKLAAGKYQITDLLLETKLVPSKAEAKRLIMQGGVKIKPASPVIASQLTKPASPVVATQITKPALPVVATQITKPASPVVATQITKPALPVVATQIRNGQVEKDWKKKIELLSGKEIVIQVGKRKFLKVKGK